MYEETRGFGLFDSRDVAAYIAQQCIANSYNYNNTKIQKLLYAAYGVVLAARNERLCDEYPRAWQYGPVFPKVFKAISKGRELAQYSYKVRKQADDGLKKLIDTAVSVYGRHTASELSAWSHKEGSPWDTVVNGQGKINDFIPDDLIVSYFRQHVLEDGDYA